MNDLISRADAIEAACNEMDWLDDGCVEERKTMIKDALSALPSAEAEPKMTEEVREALMRLTMCAREECGMCKYKETCGFDFQYKISTENMHTILEALSARPTGEWEEDEIPCEPYEPIAIVECSECGYRLGRQTWKENTFNYCPSCGAKMEVEHE